MSLEIAKEFAALLDSNKYDEASELMADDCRYHYPEGNYQGRKNIMNIYVQHHLQSKKIFDEMNYSSVVAAMPDGNFRIDFSDKIRRGHKWHELRSYQIITCTENRIVHIEHCEIPGEMESLQIFYRTSNSRNVNLP